MKVIIRTDGGNFPEIGTGHITRSLLLVNSLKSRKEFRTSNFIFATRAGKSFSFGRNKIKEAGFEIFDMFNAEYNSQKELDLLSSINFDLLIFDRLNVDPKIINALKRKERKIVIFDDETKGKKYGDLYINALLQRVPQADNILVGEDFLILPKLEKRPCKPRKTPKIIFVCFGGFDANDLSKKFLQTLEKNSFEQQINLITGNINTKKLNNLRLRAKNISANTDSQIKVLRRPLNFYDLLRNSDISVVGGGLIAFESVQHGIPSIGIPQYNHQQHNLERLKNLGVMEIGNLNPKSNLYITSQLEALIVSPSRRNIMSEKAIRVFDGEAVLRVGKAISDLLT